MTIIFPSPEWMKNLEEKLNNDPQYAKIAKNWEGELCVQIEPGGAIKEPLILYFDLWHGKCRKSALLTVIGDLKPAFMLTASYENLIRVLKGELNPMQGMMTRKLHVQGSMAYMMRNVPTVLDFVRCAREATTEILE
jgi:putative sterol carrier protein